MAEADLGFHGEIADLYYRYRHGVAVDYDVELTVDQIAGGIYLTLGADRLPAEFGDQPRQDRQVAATGGYPVLAAS